MTSKEIITNKINALKLDLEELNANDGWRGVIEHEIVQFENVLKELEELEEIKKIMGTPIQDIMKRLKVLEIFKKAFKSNSIYLINLKSSVESERITQEEYDLIKDWLNE